jgi:hypothetical protein
MIGLAILLVTSFVRLFILAFRLLFLACVWMIKGIAYVTIGTTKLVVLMIAARRN